MEEREGEQRGIRCGGHGFFTRMVATWVEKRIKDLSTQGKEKVDHV